MTKDTVYIPASLAEAIADEFGGQTIMMPVVKDAEAKAQHPAHGVVGLLQSLPASVVTAMRQYIATVDHREEARVVLRGIREAAAQELLRLNRQECSPAKPDLPEGTKA